VSINAVPSICKSLHCLVELPKFKVLVTLGVKLELTTSIEAVLINVFLTFLLTEPIFCWWVLSGTNEAEKVTELEPLKGIILPDLTVPKEPVLDALPLISDKLPS